LIAALELPVRIEARYFDGRSSAAQPAELELRPGGALRLIVGGRTWDEQLGSVRVSDRIGHMQRRIQLADGSMCEIDDNDAVDAWLRQAGAGAGAGSFMQRVFWLEQHWGVALAALVAVGLLTVGFLRYGVPALAARAADHLPIAVDAELGAHTLELLDDRLFAPSRLPAARQRHIQELFAGIVADLPGRERYRLELRTGGKAIGANAFALPSGVVVMTDELVAMTRHDDEITAVLAHEVGHVVHRHATRLLLQTSVSALVLFAVLGDVSSVSSLAAGAPALLTQARYSRQLEREADDYSYAWLRAHHIPTHYFGDVLSRLGANHGRDAAVSYFASHPPVEERIHP